MTDDRSMSIDPEPRNRAERRAQRFRPKAGLPDPHAVGNEPVEDEKAALGGDDAAAFTRSGSGEVTRLTGTGTGGATESDGRMPNHEGVRYGNQPNS